MHRSVLAASESGLRHAKARALKRRQVINTIISSQAHSGHLAKSEVWREIPHDLNIREMAMEPDTRASENFNWELQSSPRSDLAAGELLKAGAGHSRFRLDLTTNQHDRVSGMATLNATSSHKVLGHAISFFGSQMKTPGSNVCGHGDPVFDRAWHRACGSVTGKPEPCAGHGIEVPAESFASSCATALGRGPSLDYPLTSLRFIAYPKPALDDVEGSIPGDGTCQFAFPLRGSNPRSHSQQRWNIGHMLVHS
ncbi:uncharacterized protein MYCFIDRAFT_173515 [Pseudocercospora fijiensis CIRAD86]|uniref:Uncharacterized protein n=1 Tax=Pseudocercospora fijiensis (strain CIRAD86) TaxID=383855 RepID=M3B5B4_PSEFD|nr:uncharacterized protein MYCFIDRAFT_173515 [Pseudocercospora fijiensis CIRAD86]EME84552.1 hypothetical protein MYCFIDRAFT_173515 [Pseudocercospora fijiensis CIRAD86]